MCSRRKARCSAEEGGERRRWRGDRRALECGPWRGCCPVKPPQSPDSLLPLSPQSGAGVKQWGVGVTGQINPLPTKLSFHLCLGDALGTVGAAGLGAGSFRGKERRETHRCPSPYAWPGVQCPLPSFPPLLCTSLASLGPTPAQGSSQLLTHQVFGAASWLLGRTSGALFSWHGASSPTVMGPLPLPDSCLSSSSLHLQGMAGCCPQQAGEAGQGRRETLGFQSDTPARPSSLGQVPLPQFPPL